MVISIIYGKDATIQVSFTNTGSSSQKFYIGCSIAPSGGTAVDAPPTSVTLAPGGGSSHNFLFTGLKIEGLWDIRCSVWKKEPGVYGTTEADRVADTGWLSGVIKVESPAITASITSVTVNGVKVFP